MEDIIYLIFSTVVVIAAIIVPIIAKMAIKRGLTYSAMAASVWTLFFIAIGRVWHTTYELIELKFNIGEKAEIAEYGFYIIAYFIFIWLIRKAMRVKKPA